MDDAGKQVGQEVHLVFLLVRGASVGLRSSGLQPVDCALQSSRPGRVKSNESPDDHAFQRTPDPLFVCSGYGCSVRVVRRSCRRGRRRGRATGPGSHPGLTCLRMVNESPDARPRRRLRPTRRGKIVLVVGALLVVTAAVLIPLSLTGSDEPPQKQETPQSTLMIPEGRRVSQVYEAVDKALDLKPGSTLKAASTVDLKLPAQAEGNPEGYLFPATYPIDDTTEPAGLLRYMADTARKHFAADHVTAGSRRNNVSVYDTVTIASIVQRRGRHSRPTWARLPASSTTGCSSDMPLQMDSTINYALSAPPLTRRPPTPSWTARTTATGSGPAADTHRQPGEERCAPPSGPRPAPGSTSSRSAPATPGSRTATTSSRGTSRSSTAAAAPRRRADASRQTGAGGFTPPARARARRRPPRPHGGRPSPSAAA